MQPAGDRTSGSAGDRGHDHAHDRVRDDARDVRRSGVTELARVTRIARLAASAALVTLVLGGCGTAGYYTQAVRGHFAMLAQARPIDELLADHATPAPLRDRLALARRMRAFAVRELGLPDNRSYTAYADLGRPAVVWNVFAAPELSLQLKTWCYPVIGCGVYRGYFDRERADAHAAALRAVGWEVNVAPVPAYSTLGWFDDPLLNTFVGATEGELARLLFHELAHQVVYVRDDSMFNESYATAVERAGVRRWLAAHGSDETRRAYEALAGRRAAFIALLTRGRERLAAVYAAQAPDEVRRAGKRAALEALAAEYRALRESWGGWGGYDRFFDPLPNNAHLGAFATYNAWVPAFEALLEQAGGDLPRFHAAVRELARLDRAERDARLQALLASQPGR